MDKYKIECRLGDGAFGEVAKATHPDTGDVVAIKRIKRHFRTWEECLQLRELQSLKKLQHPNIVKLKQVVREEQILYFVFEFCETDLHRVIQAQTQRGGRKLGIDGIARMLRGVLTGLGHMHKHGFFHRDIKPENILVKNGAAKIADFGCAREIRSRPPFTVYVATRWYRAPELLLSSTTYSSPIDVWAVGCIFAEMFRASCLFPGSSEVDMLVKIFDAIGAPSNTNWPAGAALATKKGFRMPATARTGGGSGSPEVEATSEGHKEGTMTPPHSSEPASPL